MLGQHGHFALYASEKIPMPSSAIATRRPGFTACSIPNWARPEVTSPATIRLPTSLLSLDHDAQGAGVYAGRLSNIKRWYAEIRARPKVQAGLAIGKFEKKPFDDEARKNMFGQAAKELAGRK